MPRNIELKVACSADQFVVIENRLRERTSKPLEHLAQVDTYFRVPHGRLKLREITAADAETAELIQYRRPDEGGARTSTYQRVAIDLAAAPLMRVALGDALGILVVVRKERTVSIWHSTRIHLDQVDQLGHFVELETVLDDLTAGDDAGREEFESVVDWLGLASLRSIPGSYSDLLIEKGVPV